jgi:hypothetical protein
MFRFFETWARSIAPNRWFPTRSRGNWLSLKGPILPIWIKGDEWANAAQME